MTPCVAHVIQRQEAANRRRLDRKLDDVLNELDKIAFANIDDFTVPTADGKGREIDLSRVSRDEMAAVKKIKTETVGERITTTLELHDKRGALNDLGGHLGMGRGKLQLEVNRPIGPA
jgi:phage terminase small subunit